MSLHHEKINRKRSRSPEQDEEEVGHDTVHPTSTTKLMSANSGNRIIQLDTCSANLIAATTQTPTIVACVQQLLHVGRGLILACSPPRVTRTRGTSGWKHHIALFNHGLDRIEVEVELQRPGDGGLVVADPLVDPLMILTLQSVAYVSATIEVKAHPAMCSLLRCQVRSACDKIRFTETRVSSLVKIVVHELFSAVPVRRRIFSTQKKLCQHQLVELQSYLSLRAAVQCVDEASGSTLDAEYYELRHNGMLIAATAVPELSEVGCRDPAGLLLHHLQGFWGGASFVDSFLIVDSSGESLSKRFAVTIALGWRIQRPNTSRSSPAAVVKPTLQLLCAVGQSHGSHVGNTARQMVEWVALSAAIAGDRTLKEALWFEHDVSAVCVIVDALPGPAADTDPSSSTQPQLGYFFQRASEQSTALQRPKWLPCFPDSVVEFDGESSQMLTSHVLDALHRWVRGADDTQGRRIMERSQYWTDVVVATENRLNISRRMSLSRSGFVSGTTTIRFGETVVTVEASRQGNAEGISVQFETSNSSGVVWKAI